MNLDFWLLAHPDDEIFGIPLWSDTTNKSLFHFLVTEPPGRRREASRLQEYLTWKGFSVQVSFSKHSYPDGKVSQSLTKESLSELMSRIEAFRPNRIIVLAAEYGHQDHDFVNYLARLLSNHLNLDFIEIAAYSNAWPRFGFRVMKPEQQSTDFYPNRVIHTFLALKVAFNYRSQWRSWIGLLPGILTRYLRCRFQYSKNVERKRDLASCHPLYEKRGRSNLIFELGQQTHLDRIFTETYK